MDRLLSALKVRPGERRLTAILIGLMFFVSAGGAIGGNAIDALFFSRFGTQYLPLMYMALGVVAFVTLLGTSALLGRVTRERLYVWLPVALALVLIGERALVTLDLTWFYPILWLGMNVMGALQALFTWGLAGAATDTRQAKRLFPLFGAGGILGAAIGGFVTAPLSKAFYTENLLLVWAGALVAAFALGRALIGRAPGRPPLRRAGKPASPVDQIRQGYRFVRQSRLMSWIVVSAILFPIMMYSLVLPFSRAAAAEFPGEDALAGFLGTFQGVTTATAFLTSLLIANRLFGRFGIMAARIGLPAISVVGFSVLAVYPAFPAIVAFRFFDSTWAQGVSNAAYQALFNIVPPQRREQVRTFVNAVPDQVGVVIAGVLLAVAQQALRPQHLYLLGLGAALVLTLVLWQQRRAYRGALVDALRAGQPQVFFDEEEPFGGLQRDASAASVAVAGLLDPDTTVRRVSVEILGHLPVPGASDALIDALSDQDAEVRAAALHALACAHATPALLDVAVCLNDPEPEVRTEAVEALRQLAGYRRGLAVWIRPLLADSSPAVRARVAATLLRDGFDSEVRRGLADMAEAGDPESRIQAMNALGEWGDPQALEWIAAGLRDPLPGVRRAAALAFAPVGIRLGGDNADSREESSQPLQASTAPGESASSVTSYAARSWSEPLVRALGDDDSAVREAAAAAIGRIGASRLDAMVSALFDPALEGGALLALEYLPIRRAENAIREYARDSASRAVHYHDLMRDITTARLPDRAQLSGVQVSGVHPDHSTAFARPLDHPTTRLLADSLGDAAQRRAINALRAVGLLTDRRAMATAIDNLRSRDPHQRAYAMETLESIGEPHILRPLLSLWEAGEAAPAHSEGWLTQLLGDSDAWLRACAALVAGAVDDPHARDLLAHLAQSDADALVRETAAHGSAAMKGDLPVHTLATLSLMERVLFLRRVPLFADLAPADLKYVAAIAEERFFHDGDVIARQGEPGDEMFIIVSGEVRVLESADGEPEALGLEVARRQPGEVVGEMALISQGPRVASMVAVDPVRVLCIDQKQFEGMLRERPEIRLAVMRVLIARLKESDAKARAVS